MLCSIAAVCAATFATSKDLLSKRLSSEVDGTVSTLASFAYALPYYGIALGIMTFCGLPFGDLGASFWVLVIFRSLTDGCAEWLKMNALAHADISLVAPFFALSPLILLVLGPIISHDHITFWGGAGVILTVIGTVGMAPKNSPHQGQLLQDRRAIGLALLASIFFAFNSLLDRLAVQQTSSIMSGAAMTAGATIPFILPVIFSKERRVGFTAQARLFTARAFFEFLFMSLKLFALTLLPSSYVVGILRLSMLFSVVGGAYFFHEREIKKRLVWSCIISFGVVLIVLNR